MPEEVTVIELKHLATGLASQPAPATEISSSWAVPARRGSMGEGPGQRGAGCCNVLVVGRHQAATSRAARGAGLQHEPTGYAPAAALPMAANMSARPRRPWRQEVGRDMAREERVVAWGTL